MARVSAIAAIAVRRAWRAATSSSGSSACCSRPYRLARAIRTGEDWGPAIVLAVVTVAYTFVPWVKKAQSERAQRAGRDR